VYNAKSDILNSAFDFAHKIISPKTYNCNLCILTHGNFGEKKEWNEYRKGSNHKLKFLHNDEFETQYPREQYPVVFEVIGDTLKTVLTSEELNEINSTGELIDKLKEM
jgi:hypothetical protein